MERGQALTILMITFLASLNKGLSGELLEKTTPTMILSPQYPINYPPNADISWRVTSEPGTSIIVTFIKSDLETGYDWIRIYNGSDDSGPPLVSLTGHNELPFLQLRANSVFIRFQSDASVEYGGFMAKIEDISSCPGGSESVTPVTISTYNNYQTGNYASYSYCTWNVTSEEGTVITISFSRFSASGSDSLEIYDGPDTNSTLLHTFVWSTLPPNVTTSSNHVYLKFQADGHYESTGFSAFLDSEVLGSTTTSPPTTTTVTDPTTPAPVCGDIEELDAPFTITYPAYDNDVISCWLISAAPGSATEIRFSFLDTESSEDVITIYGGSDVTAPVLLATSGDVLPSPVLTRSATILVKFTSDGANTGGGFTAHFKPIAGCGTGGTSVSAPLNISSPNYPANYPNSFICTWNVSAPAGNFLKVTFFDLETEYCGWICGCDQVIVYDGPTNKSPFLGRYCGDELPAVTWSTSNQIVVRFKSDLYKQRRGFELSVEVVTSVSVIIPPTSTPATITADDPCNGGVVIHAPARMDSPRYPRHYPPNAWCGWQIHSQPDTIVRMKFSRMDVEGCVLEGCEPNDYLRVYDGPDDTAALIATRYGKKSSAIYSTQNQTFIRFRSDFNVQYVGFTIAVKHIEKELLSSVDCVFSCEGKPNGNYQLCSRCDKYAKCKKGALKKRKCTKGKYWDDNKKRCVPTSKTCTI